MYELWFLGTWVCSCVKAWGHECEWVLLWSPVHVRYYLLFGVRCRVERYIKLCLWTKLNYYLKFYVKCDSLPVEGFLFSVDPGDHFQRHNCL
jgi:hypothetical protein